MTVCSIFEIRHRLTLSEPVISECKDSTGGRYVWVIFTPKSKDKISFLGRVQCASSMSDSFVIYLIVDIICDQILNVKHDKSA